jgi:hydrogenase expression/formation protein HypE
MRENKYMENKTPIPNFESNSCPLPLSHKDKIVMSHGSGGSMTRDLIISIFQKYFSNAILDRGNDFADIQLEAGKKVIVSTDGHIISPIFFPGGDIGRLAVSGTVNDIAMSGCQPSYLTASFILEEGFSITDLDKIAASMQAAADESGVQIIAGDTKVAEKGKADGIFISTTGIGFADANLTIGGENAKSGDAVIISGTLGDHGIAVLAARNQLGFKTTIQSDVAPLNHLIQAALQAAPDIHVLRDPTRGGLATTLNEIACQSQVNIQLEETAIPVKREVRAACEMLGFDPLYVANEGKVIIILPAVQADAALAALRDHPLGSQAVLIGHVTESSVSPRVSMHTLIGGTRIVDMLSGEMLPRIC